MAASKSGATGTGISELAALGNHGRSSNHCASQMVTKYCQSEQITFPNPYFAEIPCLVKKPNEWEVELKSVALFLPHELFAWLEGQEQVSGFSKLATFWQDHLENDPKLKFNPAKIEPQLHLCVCRH